GRSRQPESRTTRSRSFGCLLGEHLEQAAPAAVGVDLLGDLRPVRAVALEVAVLELDERARLALGDEAHLVRARLLGLGVVVPLALEVPGHDDPVGTLEHEHPAPVALAPVDAALEQAAALVALHHRVGHVGVADVVAVRPPAVEAGREHVERALLRRLNGDALADRQIRGVHGHRTSSSVCSAALLKAARAWFQNWSRYARRAPMPSGSSW